jgi:uncharacterized protein YecE (DUF72 family)
VSKPCKIDREKQRQRLYRHRRLDLRAVARRVSIRRSSTQAKELSYAASKLTSIEINGTYYGSQKPESFRKWAREVPDGFVFSLKGRASRPTPRAGGRPAIPSKRFYDSGVLETRRPARPGAVAIRADQEIRRADFGKFLELLPRKLDGRALRHVVEVRHDSFCVPDFIALLRKFERRSYSPSTANIRRSPTSRAISSMRGCRRAMTNSRPAIRQTARRLGEAVSGLGRRWRARRSAPCRRGPNPRRRRATSSPTSSMRAKCVRPRARWN